MKTILVIEDNLDIRENLEEILELDSYKVLSAPNGKICLEKALHENPSLILCDIAMPEKNGYEVFAAIQLAPFTQTTNLIGHYDKTEQQDKRMRHVSRIASSVKNLNFILNDFLSLEKLESGKINYNPNPIDFEEYVDSFMDEI